MMSLFQTMAKKMPMDKVQTVNTQQMKIMKLLEKIRMLMKLQPKPWLTTHKTNESPG